MATPAFNYGSDVTGLVWGFLLQDAAQAVSVDAKDAETWLRAPVPGQFVWLHFNLSNAASERWLRAHAGLPEEFYETLHQGSRSTRIEVADGSTEAAADEPASADTVAPLDRHGQARVWVIDGHPRYHCTRARALPASRWRTVP